MSANIDQFEDADFEGIIAVPPKKSTPPPIKTYVAPHQKIPGECHQAETEAACMAFSHAGVQQCSWNSRISSNGNRCTEMEHFTPEPFEKLR